MAFELPAVPNLNVQIPQMPDPMQKYGQMLALKNMLGQQKMLPLQMQEEQQRVQQGDIATQRAQMALQSEQNFQKLFANSDNESEMFGTSDSGNPPGPNGEALPFDPRKSMSFFAKNKVMPETFMPFVANLVDQSSKMSEMAKNLGAAAADRFKLHADVQNEIADTLAPIMKMPVSQASQALADAKPGFAKIPGIDGQTLAALNALTIDQVPKAVVAMHLDAQMAGFYRKQAEASSAQSAATKAAIETAPPTPKQMTDATTTLNAYGAIPQDMQAGLANEMKAAPTFANLQQIQARADAANESFQRSADARQQASALKDVGIQEIVAGKLVAQDQNMRAALANSQGIRSELDMSNGGNEVATNAALQRFAEHEVAEGGIKRFNELEQRQLISGVGSYGRQFRAWAAKGFTGKAPQATNAEIHAILNNEDKIAMQQHDENVSDIQSRYSSLSGKSANGANIRPPRAAGFALPQGAPTATGPGGHKIGFVEGKWVDATTGKPIQ